MQSPLVSGKVHPVQAIAQAFACFQGSQEAIGAEAHRIFASVVAVPAGTYAGQAIEIRWTFREALSSFSMDQSEGACRLVDLIAAGGVDIDAHHVSNAANCGRWETLLHTALIGGSAPLVEFLLARGADPYKPWIPIDSALGPSFLGMEYDAFQIAEQRPEISQRQEKRAVLKAWLDSESPSLRFQPVDAISAPTMAD